MRNDLYFCVIVVVGLFLFGVVIPLRAEDRNEDVKQTRWTVAFHGGWGIRIGALPEDIDSDVLDILSRAKRGFYGQVSIGYDISRHFPPIGLTVKGFYSSVDREEIPLSTHILLVGPYFRFFQKDLERHRALLEFGPGCLFYKSGGVASIGQTVSGAAFGFNASCYYEYRLSEMMAISFSFSGTNGILKKANLTEGSAHQQVELEEEEFLSLMHWGLSLGLRYGF